MIPLQHPAFFNLAFCLLAIWPAMRVLSRAGLRPGWTTLLMLNLVMPGLGLALLAAVLCHCPWPAVPDRPKRQVKTKVWGQE